MATPNNLSPSLNAYNPGIVESQVQQLTASSLSGYGQAPNPQAVYESIVSGSTPVLSQALQSGNPLLQATLAGTPAGGTVPGITPYGTPPKQLNDPNTNLYNFNPNQDQQTKHNLLEQDQNSGWRSFGDLPRLNFGWMDSVRKGNPNTVKQWQQYLKDHNFLESGYQTGTWDQGTEQGFQQFMISWATPQALFSQDLTQKGNATMFLQGLGIDVNSLAGQIGRDPSGLAQVAQNWMATQGPDAQSGTKNELQQYSDQFGQASLPQSYQAILQNNFFQTIRDGLSSLPVVGDIPVIGGVFHGAVNVLTGNLDLQHLTQDPRAVRAQQIQAQMQNVDKLSQTDIKNLAPSLMQVQQDAGFLGFLDDYDHARTKGLLASVYTLGDLFTGKFDAKRDNPFDPMSGVNLQAQMHQDNMFAGLFGDTAANANPTWAGIFNFAANVVDDPTSYIPLIGQMEWLQKARGLRTVGRVIGNDEARSAFHDLTAETIKQRGNQEYFNAMRAMVAQGGHYGLADIAQFGGLSGAGTAHEADQLRLLQKAMDPKMDPQEGWNLFLEGDGTATGYGDRINAGATVYNAKAAWSSLAQVKSHYILGKARAMGGMSDTPLHMAASSPIATSQFLRNASVIAGMGAEEIRPILDRYVTTALDRPQGALAAVEEAKQSILDSYFQKNGIRQEDFTKWVQQHRQGRVLPGGPRQAMDDTQTLTYAPDPSGSGREMSRAPRSTDTVEAKVQAGLMEQLQSERRLLEQSGADPHALQEIDSQIRQISRPAPMLTTQLADSWNFPYSLYEMVAYKNPAMRVLDSVQSRIHLDALMNTWKRITIGRISSALRITLGDDAIRPAIHLIGQGHFVAGMSYLTRSVLNAFGLLVPGARGRVLDNLEKMLQQNPEARSLLQQISHFAQDGDTRGFIPLDPKSNGYVEQLQHLLENHFGKDPIAQTWLKAYNPDDLTATREATHAFLRNSDHPAVANWKDARRADSAHGLSLATDTFHDWMSAFFANPDMRRFALEGTSRDELRKFVREGANDSSASLPVIPVPNTGSQFGRALLQRVATKPADWVFEHMTAPMVNQARARGFIAIKHTFAEQMRRYYKDRPGRQGQDFENLIDQASTSRALDWITNNTYQGTRSVMGATVRNLFPFYGATTNMDRFFLRQSMSVPWLGSAIAHTALKTQQAQSPVNQTSPGMTMLEGVLGHLGFGGGEGVRMDPSHMFFLTADGIGSMVPGTGPLFGPLWNTIGKNPTMANILSELIPGASTQIDYATGQAKPMFPFLADLISGTSMALTGSAPDLGPLTKSQDSLNAAVDRKVQERERETGKPVGQSDLDSIRREVGRDLMLQGGLSYTLPFSPSVENTQSLQTSQNLDQWRQQTTDAGKDQVITQALGVSPQEWEAAITRQPNAPSVADLISRNPQSDAAVMAYEDRRISPEDRNAISGVAPWVVSAATSHYQRVSLGPDQVSAPVDLAQWQVMRQLGDITLMDPQAYIGAINNERDINTGWQEYDAYKNYEYQTLIQNGWSTTTPAFKLWQEQVFNPLVMGLQQLNPTWWKAFGQTSQGGSGEIALSGATRPLRTLMTWEAIPQHSDFETQQSVLWRNAIQLRDQAAGAIMAVHARHGTKAEEEMVMQGLQAQLAALAQQDPGFAANLGQFRFGNWMDVVNLEADEMQAQAGVA